MSKASWLGATTYREKRYDFRDCLDCGSIYVSPMPDEKALTQMYGVEYHEFLSIVGSHGGSSGIQDVIEHLSSLPHGLFIDYACGAGALLREVANIGWEVIGVEFDSETAAKFGSEQGVSIVCASDAVLQANKADVIHLGDVIEHLTDVNHQFPKILSLLKKGGTLIAQGPLEANRNLFHSVIRFVRQLRSNAVSDMAPYHVSLATSKGQLRFFERFGLRQIEFRVFETAHPAPGSIVLKDFYYPRKVCLFFLRKFSQFVTSRFNNGRGNRYFYVGIKS